MDAGCPNTHYYTHAQNKAHRLYLGLETPSNGRPHVVNRNNDISLDADAQRENHLSLLDPVFSGEYSSDLADRMRLNSLRCQHFKPPTSSSRTPARWWRSLSRRWGCRRTDDSRCAACWSRGWDSWWGLWSLRAWNGANWASLTPCYTHNRCTCTDRRNVGSVTLFVCALHFFEIMASSVTEAKSSRFRHLTTVNVICMSH